LSTALEYAASSLPKAGSPDEKCKALDARFHHIQSITPEKLQAPRFLSLITVFLSLNKNQISNIKPRKLKIQATWLGSLDCVASRRLLLIFAPIDLGPTLLLSLVWDIKAMLAYDVASIAHALECVRAGDGDPQCGLWL
jgi:hypothetical protein